VLVSSRKSAQDVKLLVDRLKSAERTEHVTHRRVYRPWGSYEGIDDGSRYQVKRLTVNPGAKLSLQPPSPSRRALGRGERTARVTRAKRRSCSPRTSRRTSRWA